MPRWASIPKGGYSTPQSGVTRRKMAWSNYVPSSRKPQQIRGASTPHGVTNLSTCRALLHSSGGVYKTPGVEWRDFGAVWYAVSTPIITGRGPRLQVCQAALA